MILQYKIGGDSGKTWAHLRSPMVIGTGYRESWPFNENWSTAGFGDETEYSHSSGFPNPQSELLKAKAEVLNGEAGGSQYVLGAFLGCSQVFISQEEGGVLTWIFLGCGDGIYTAQAWNPGDPSLPSEFVYSLETPNFDTHLMRNKFVGWTVNVTIAPYVGATPVDYEFQITNDLFPDEPWKGSPTYQNRGQKFAEIITPYGSQTAPIWWTINSLTPP